MNKPINIQSFVCEIDKCPDIQRLKAENEKYKQTIEDVKKVIDSECSNCVKLYHSCAGHCYGVFNVKKILKEMDEVLKDE